MRPGGTLQLAFRTAGSFLGIAADAAREALGTALPRTPEQIARPSVLDALFQTHPPADAEPLPRVASARLPGVEFESSNCRNFLVDLEFEPGQTRRDLPRSAYVKLPCDALTTRAFANTLGFWHLEYTFCKEVAHRLPVRTPRVYAAARKGSRFVLLLENLHEIPGARLFINRDVAAGTTPERAAKVMKCFAQLHAAFWGWPENEREKILPAALNPFLSAKSRAMTRALNASAIAPAMRAAPEILTPAIGDTYREAMDRWDALLAAWYTGPLTLIHGDSHLGNCFEYPEGGETEVGLLDFQAIHWSKGMRDVQYFLINSLEPDVLESCEADLIDLYRDELAGRGIVLSREDAFEQYRAFSFQTLLVGVIPLGLGNLTERETTVRTFTRRSAAAIERLGFREWMLAQG